jgi:hypothetical protein
LTPRNQGVRPSPIRDLQAPGGMPAALIALLLLACGQREHMGTSWLHRRLCRSGRDCRYSINAKATSFGAGLISCGSGVARPWWR